MRAASGRFNLNLGRKDRKDNAEDHNDGTTGSPVGSSSGGGFTFGHPDRGTNGSGGGGDLAKTLKNKVAHTTIMPNLVGTQSLRELQDLITAEKSILQSHERLANDISKGCNAMATWGASEGSDLSDVLSHASAILMHLSNAMNKYADHEASIRLLYKSIRTKEEQLEDMVKRRKQLGSRAEKEEKKLAKMSQENKNLPSQTELLESLREQMRQLDTEILTEEAKVGDFKRVTTKKALGLKFGGCLELAEKATIVGELGKLLVEEIPLEETPPGYGRAPYHGFEQTDRLANEAARCIADVVFQPVEVKSLPPGLPHAPALDPLRTPSVSQLNGEQGDDYRRYASAYGDDPNGLQSPSQRDDEAQGYDSAIMAPPGQNPYDRSNQRPNVMFAVPTSPMSSRNPSYAVEPRMGVPIPSGSLDLDPHEYEYAQAREKEMERPAQQAYDDANQITSPSSGLNNPWQGDERQRVPETMIPEPREQGSTLAYLGGGDAEQAREEPANAGFELPGVQGGTGKIMDRGRVTRRHDDDEDEGVTTSYHAHHNPVVSPIDYSDFDAQAAARNEVRRERESFGIALKDDSKEQFYTPAASPGMANRQFFPPGSGQRTISAGAFKRNRDRDANRTPTQPTAAVADGLAPTAPLNIQRPGSAQSTGRIPVPQMSTDSEYTDVAHDEPADQIGGRAQGHGPVDVEGDVDIGLGEPLPPPVYGDSRHDPLVHHDRAELR